MSTILTNERGLRMAMHNDMYLATQFDLFLCCHKNFCLFLPKNSKIEGICQIRALALNICNGCLDIIVFLRIEDLILLFHLVFQNSTIYTNNTEYILAVHPYTTYSVSVRVRPVQGGYWSEAMSRQTTTDTRGN